MHVIDIKNEYLLDIYTIAMQYIYIYIYNIYAIVAQYLSNVYAISMHIYEYL